MRKILLMLFTAALLFCTSGCTKNEYTISIDKNDKVFVDEISAFNIDGLITLAGSFDENASDKIRKDLDSELEEAMAEKKSNGYEVQKYDKDGYLGFETRKDYDDFNSVKLPEGFTFTGDSFVNVTDSLWKRNYKISLKFNPKLQAESSDNPAAKASSRLVPSEEEMAAYDESAERAMDKMGMKPVLSLTIKLPSAAKNTNANSKDDETFVYQWNLDIKKVSLITAEYEQIKTTNIIILCLIVFLLIGAAVYLHNKNETPQGF